MMPYKGTWRRASCSTSTFKRLKLWRIPIWSLQQPALVREDGEALAELVADLAGAFAALLINPTDFPDLLECFWPHNRFARAMDAIPVCFSGAVEPAFNGSTASFSPVSTRALATGARNRSVDVTTDARHDRLPCLSGALASRPMISAKPSRARRHPNPFDKGRRNSDGSSRWLTRLETVLGPLIREIKNKEIVAVADLLDTPAERIEIRRLNPAPPLDARPNRYSVTEIETLITDPYQVFAKRI